MKNLVKSLVGVLFLTLAQVAYAAPATHEFSADMVSVANGQQFEAKLYVGKDKVRVEMPENIIITRMDRRVSYMIMPSQGMYMENPIDQSKLMKTSKEVEGELERVPLGNELVNGQMAQKFKVTYRDGEGQSTMYQWIGDSDIPVKMQALDGSWSMEYKNIKKGAPNDSLFEVPSGLKKFEMPNMANMMAAAQNAQD